MIVSKHIWRVQTTCEERFIPQRQHPSDAGADLRAAGSVMLMPGQKALISTEVRLAIPEGYVGLVLPRSGLARDGIVAIPGTIDAGYRGEIKVLLYNLACMDKFVVHVGDRIAQLVIFPVECPEFMRVPDLPPGDREENGSGSTGR